jgi:hypothetical protein
MADASYDLPRLNYPIGIGTSSQKYMIKWVDPSKKDPSFFLEVI